MTIPIAQVTYQAVIWMKATALGKSAIPWPSICCKSWNKQRGDSEPWRVMRSRSSLLTSSYFPTSLRPCSPNTHTHTESNGKAVDNKEPLSDPRDQGLWLHCSKFMDVTYSCQRCANSCETACEHQAEVSVIKGKTPALGEDTADRG